jgi:hypothetical protein
MRPNHCWANPLTLALPFCPGEFHSWLFITQFLPKIAKQPGNLSTL